MRSESASLRFLQSLGDVLNEILGNVSECVWRVYGGGSLYSLVVVHADVWYARENGQSAQVLAVGQHDDRLSDGFGVAQLPKDVGIRQTKPVSSTSDGGREHGEHKRAAIYAANDVGLERQ